MYEYANIAVIKTIQKSPRWVNCVDVRLLYDNFVMDGNFICLNKCNQNVVSPSQGTTGELVRMADRALAADYRKSSTAAQMSRSSHIRLCWPLRPPQGNHRIHYVLRKKGRPPSHQYGYRMLSRPHPPSHGYRKLSQPYLPSHGYRKLSQPYLPSHGYRKLSQPYLPSHGYRKLSQPYLPSHGYRKLSQPYLPSRSSQLWPPKTAAL